MDFTESLQAFSPVRLRLLASKFDGAGVVLQWKTAVGDNSAGYEVQRSAELPAWEPVGFVESRKEGRAASSYTFRDGLPSALLRESVVYYRLRQVDPRSTDRYSTVIAVDTRMDLSGIGVLQRSGGMFISRRGIDFSLPSKQKVSLIVSDLAGNTILRLVNNAVLEPGKYVTALDGDSLPIGYYLCSLVTPTARYSRTLRVQQ